MRPSPCSQRRGHAVPAAYRGRREGRHRRHRHPAAAHLAPALRGLRRGAHAGGARAAPPADPADEHGVRRDQSGPAEGGARPDRRRRAARAAAAGRAGARAARAAARRDGAAAARGSQRCEAGCLDAAAPQGDPHAGAPRQGLAERRGALVALRRLGREGIPGARGLPRHASHDDAGRDRTRGAARPKRDPAAGPHDGAARLHPPPVRVVAATASRRESSRCRTTTCARAS